MKKITVNFLVVLGFIVSWPVICVALLFTYWPTPGPFVINHEFWSAIISVAILLVPIVVVLKLSKYFTTSPKYYRWMSVSRLAEITVPKMRDLENRMAYESGLGEPKAESMKYFAFFLQKGKLFHEKLSSQVREAKRLLKKHGKDSTAIANSLESLQKQKETLSADFLKICMTVSKVEKLMDELKIFRMVSPDLSAINPLTQEIRNSLDGLLAKLKTYEEIEREIILALSKEEGDDTIDFASKRVEANQKKNLF